MNNCPWRGGCCRSGFGFRVNGVGGVDAVRHVATDSVTGVTAYILCEAVDERGSLDVGVQQVVQRVVLGKLAVHRYHGSFHDEVGVPKVRDILVDAGVRGRKQRDTRDKTQG